jgi:hypothetical protein
VKPQPLQQLLNAALEMAPEDFAADEARQRSVDAREVRDRLPHFVRTGTAADLAERIGHPGLLAIAKTWAWGGGNVLLLGPTKAGKSTAAAYLFRRLLGESVRFGGEAWQLAQMMRWHSATDLAFARKTHPLGQGDAPDVIEASNARLLFLDDAGWETDVSAVCDVLNARYERCWPTVITSGKTRDELTAHYGAAVVRRIREAGGKRAAIVDCFALSVAR